MHANVSNVTEIGEGELALRHLFYVLQARYGGPSKERFTSKVCFTRELISFTFYYETSSCIDTILAFITFYNLRKEDTHIQGVQLSFLVA